MKTRKYFVDGALVPGHYKTQPYGKNSELRKIIWRDGYAFNYKDKDILCKPE